jgi:hypothetical protein
MAQSDGIQSSRISVGGLEISYAMEIFDSIAIKLLCVSAPLAMLTVRTE